MWETKTVGSIDRDPERIDPGTKIYFKKTETKKSLKCCIIKHLCIMK